jgi:hypothetical protein
VRGRFVLTEPAPVTSYTVSQAEIMATVAASEPLDRTADFQALAMRNAMNAMREQALDRFGRRGADRWRQSERGWPVVRA